MLKDSRQIETEGDFEDEALDILESFIQRLIEEGGWTRKPEEDDGFDVSEIGENFVVYTDKAQTLILKMMERLLKVGNKHFPTNEICLRTSMYQEP